MQTRQNTFRGATGTSGARVQAGHPCRQERHRATMFAMKHFLLAFATLLSVSCARNDGVTAVDRDQFVSIVAELREAAARTRGEPGEFDEIKARILEQHNVTEDDLRHYVEVHSRDVDHMAEVWTAVNEKLSERSMDIQ